MYVRIFNPKWNMIFLISNRQDTVNLYSDVLTGKTKAEYSYQTWTSDLYFVKKITVHWLFVLNHGPFDELTT